MSALLRVCGVSFPLQTEGDPTTLGEWARWFCGILGAFNGLALVPAGFFDLLSVMICGGGCSAAQRFYVTLMTLSPLFMLVGMMSGVAVFRSPTWRLVALTIVPSILTMIGFAGGL
jgi:hypothetical protein